MASPELLVLNQSRLKQYLNCQRLYGFEQIENLSPALRRSALEIGTAVHHALAAFHSGATVDEAVSASSASLRAALGPSTVYDKMTVEEADSIAARVLRGYFAHWQKDDQLWAPLNQEIEFLVEIRPGWWRRTFGGEPDFPLAAPTGIWLRGRADNLSFLKGALFLIDYKTAGRMDPRDMLKYELDIQLSCYIYGLSKQLTEDSAKDGGVPIRIEGAIIDLLVKTQVPQYTRESFTRSTAEMEELELELVEYGSRIRSAHSRVAAGEPWKQVFPRNTSHCFAYSTCSFRDLCAHDTPERRAAYTVRQTDYVDAAYAQLSRPEEKK